MEPCNYITEKLRPATAAMLLFLWSLIDARHCESEQ